MDCLRWVGHEFQMQFEKYEHPRSVRIFNKSLARWYRAGQALVLIGYFVCYKMLYAKVW